MTTSPPKKLPSKTTRLKRAPDLRISIDSSNEAFIEYEGGHLYAGNRALGVLEAFSEESSIEEVLQKLPAATAADWIEIADCAQRLFASGLLREPNAGRTRATLGYAMPDVHIAMLSDQARTRAFLEAIAKVVQPGDTVLDIGTGTGILALAAARAGAKKVYAIESSQIAESAAAMFEKNGVADRVTVIRGWSTQVSLPEKADVLVTELIGNDPYEEQLDAVVRDARRRLLTPNARVIPETLSALLIPVAIPERYRNRYVITPRMVAEWEAAYGFSFDPLVELPSVATFFVPPQEAAGWPQFSSAVSLPVSAEQSFLKSATTCTSSGTIDGVLVAFETTLASGIVLSTAPRAASATNHWRSPVWFVQPVEVNAGDTIELSYRLGDGVGGKASVRRV